LNLEEVMRIAMGISHEAGSLLERLFADAGLTVSAKGPRDVVTRADIESEALVKRRLEEAFPDHGVVGEEGTDTSNGKRYRWFVDPLDGTLNFSRGVPVWCVSLALFEGNTPLVGVVYDPLRRETFHAARTHGARCNGQLISSSGCTDESQAFIHVTVDFNDESRREGLEDIQRLAPAVLRTRNLGSAALELAYVAAGRMDAMLHRHAHAWDYGAGVLLVRESGGHATSMTGTQWEPDDESMAASATEQLGTALLRRVQGVGMGPLQ
jgi:myo-inositol-1(or 4)-monophosphatase